MNKEELTMTIEIKQYQQHDLKDLLNIWESASRVAHSFMPESFFEQGLSDIPH